MTTYSFPAVSGTTIAFDPLNDVLAFPSGYTGLYLGIEQSGADVLVRQSGSTVRLSGIAFTQLADANFSFANGEVVRLDSGGNDALAGSAGSDYLDLRKGGSDTVAAGAGGDRVYAGNALDAGDQVNGGTPSSGSDVDELVLAGNYASGVVFGANTVTGIELIRAESDSTIRLTLHANTVATAQGFTIDATAQAQSDLLRVDATAVAGAITVNAGDGNDEILSGAGSDVLNGGDGSDVISGGANNDLIRGGLGADTLTGGAGVDTFAFNLTSPRTESSPTTIDTITDFEGGGAAGGDLIDLPAFSGSLALAFNEDPIAFVYAGGGGSSGVQLPASLIGDGFADVVWKHDATQGRVEVWVDANDDGQFSEVDLLVHLMGASSLSLADFVDNFPAWKGTGGADTYTGNAAANIAYGVAGNDVLDGQGGADSLYGGSGSDTILGGDGGDYLLGEDGSDTLHGGDGNDSLYAGTDAAGMVNALYGEGGSDYLYGGAGDDLLDGGVDNDTLQGSGGADTLLGGDGNDTLHGDDGTDTLGGGAGADVLGGGGGNDIVDGGAGQDTLSGEGLGFYGYAVEGVDQLTGGADADTFDFSNYYGGYQNGYGFYGSTLAVTDTITDFDAAAGDRIRLAYNAAPKPIVLRGEVTTPGFTLSAGATLGGDDLGSGFTQVWSHRSGGTTYLIADLDDDRVLDGSDFVVALSGPAAPLTLSVADFVAGTFSVQVGTPGDDDATTLVPTEGVDVIYGVGGNDTLSGLGGNDQLYGGEGNDALDGGADADTLSGGAGDDTILGGEGGDSINGEAGSDTLHGGDGNDSLSAGTDAAGAINALYGEGGSDYVYGNAGDDLLDGGTGNDTLSGYLGADTLLGGDGNDTLSGDDDADTLSGGDGADVLAGGGGADIVDGGAGQDTLSGEGLGFYGYAVEGGDQLTGGADADTFDFSNYYGGYQNGYGFYGSTLAVTDTITDFDAAQGDRIRLAYYTAPKPVVLRGDVTTPGFTLTAGATLGGDDLGTGFTQLWSHRSGGTTYLIADLDDDRVLDSTDFVLALTGSTAPVSFSEGDFVAGTLNVQVGTPGDDDATTLVPTEGVDIIYGVGGNDTLSGLGAGDQLYGGDGNDALDGGFGGDQLYGGTGDDVIHGGDGGDTLYGDAGSDVLHGGNDADTLSAGTDAAGTINALYGEGGGDYLYGGVGDDLLDGGADNDTLYGGGGQDALLGGDGNDTLGGDDDADTLVGGAGADVLAGGGGADMVDGGAGQDTLTGEGLGFYGYAVEGVDQLIGGADADTFDFSNYYGGYQNGYGFYGSTLAVTDTITDFDAAAGDRIRLAYNGAPKPIVLRGEVTTPGFTLSAGATLGGDDLGTGFTQLWSHRSGGTTYLIADLDDDRVLDSSDFVVALTGPTAPVSIATGHFVAGTFSDVVGTGGDDVIDGTAGSDAIHGAPGNDVLNGLADSDRLYGGTGDDVLDGGDGGDTLYGGAGSDTLRGGLNADSLYGDTGIDTLIGDFGNDYLYGGQDNDTLDGGADDDYLVGEDGADILHGGANNDSLYGYSGNDFLDGGLQDDTMDGGAGADIFFFRATGQGNDHIHGFSTLDGDSFHLAAGFFTNAVEAGGNTTLTYSGGTIVVHGVTGRTLEQWNALISGRDEVLGAGNDVYNGTAAADVVHGDLGNDELNGLDGDDALYGDAGNDALNGGIGNDLLEGGAGNDALDGGLDTDTAVYGGNRADYTATDLGGGIVRLVDNRPGSPDGTDTLAGVEQVTFAVGTVPIAALFGVTILVNLTAANDTYVAPTPSDHYVVDGLAGNDSITTQAGNDTVRGNGGDDTIVTAGGNDIITFSGATTGFDIVDGGAGTDQLRALASSTVIGLRSLANVESITGNGFSGVQVRGSTLADTLDFSAVTLTGIASIDGNSGNDTITGSAAADVIIAGAGDDTLLGGGGDDTLNVGSGAGSDAFDGGGGNDLVRAMASNVAIGMRAFAGIETVSANGFSNVSILGNSAANVLDFSATTLVGITLIDAGSGNDTVTGSAGNDVIAASTGDDVLNAGDGDDIVNVGSSAGFDAIDGGAGADVVRARANNMSIKLSALANVETITSDGFTGVTILGSAGANVLDFSSVALVGIGLIDGGNGADTITGTALADTISGGNGQDTIDAGDGDDVVRFGVGTNDFIQGGAGSDTLRALAAGSTVLWPNVGGIEVVDAAGFANVSLLGTVNADVLDLSGVLLLNVVIDGGSGNDTITGTAAADVINGNTGVDIISAGAGDDTIRFGAATTDVVDGGADVDTLKAVAANASILWTNVMGVEAVDGTGFGGVTVLGTAAANVLDFSAITLTNVALIDGGDGADTIIGSAGNDVITGNLGTDVIHGGEGNDTIRFAAGNVDTVDGGSGVDTLRANAASATIVWTNVANVEVLDGTGFSGVAALGTASDNVLDFSGVALVNVARIDGLGGNDTITGSAGNDVIVGGAGKDVLTGSDGADTFDFNLVSESTLANFDEILDFLQGSDRIDLLTIDANGGTAGNQDFAFIGSGSFTGVAGQLRYDVGLSGVTRILADTNGDSVADMEVRLVGSHALTAADFIGVV